MKRSKDKPGDFQRKKSQQEPLLCLCGEGGLREGAPVPQVSSFADVVVGGATSCHREVTTVVLSGREQGWDGPGQ